MFILADNRRYDAMSFLNHQFAGAPQLASMRRGPTLTASRSQ